MTEGSAVYYPSRMNGSGAPFGLALACCCYLRFVVLVLFGNVDVDVVSRFRVFVRVVLGPYDIPKKQDIVETKSILLFGASVSSIHTRKRRTNKRKFGKEIRNNLITAPKLMR